jgi:hypothetical protein
MDASGYHEKAPQNVQEEDMRAHGFVGTTGGHK